MLAERMRDSLQAELVEARTREQLGSDIKSKMKEYKQTVHDSTKQ